MFDIAVEDLDIAIAVENLDIAVEDLDIAVGIVEGALDIAVEGAPDIAPSFLGNQQLAFAVTSSVVEAAVVAELEPSPSTSLIPSIEGTTSKIASMATTAFAAAMATTAVPLLQGVTAMAAKVEFAAANAEREMQEPQAIENVGGCDHMIGGCEVQIVGGCDSMNVGWDRNGRAKNQKKSKSGRSSRARVPRWDSYPNSSST